MSSDEHPSAPEEERRSGLLRFCLICGCLLLVLVGGCLGFMAYQYYRAQDPEYVAATTQELVPGAQVPEGWKGTVALAWGEGFAVLTPEGIDLATIQQVSETMPRMLVVMGTPQGLTAAQGRDQLLDTIRNNPQVRQFTLAEDEQVELEVAGHALQGWRLSGALNELDFEAFMVAFPRDLAEPSAPRAMILATAPEGELDEEPLEALLRPAVEAAAAGGGAPASPEVEEVEAQ